MITVHVNKVRVGPSKGRPIVLAAVKNGNQRIHRLSLVAARKLINDLWAGIEMAGGEPREAETRVDGPEGVAHDEKAARIAAAKDTADVADLLP